MNDQGSERQFIHNRQFIPITNRTLNHPNYRNQCIMVKMYLKTKSIYFLLEEIIFVIPPLIVTIQMAAMIPASKSEFGYATQ